MPLYVEVFSGSDPDPLTMRAFKLILLVAVKVRVAEVAPDLLIWPVTVILSAVIVTLLPLLSAVLIFVTFTVAELEGV